MATANAEKRDTRGAKNSNYRGLMDRLCRRCKGNINGSSVTRKYCSRACQAAAYRSPENFKTCPWCAKDFYHRASTHCSAVCASSARAAKAKNPGRKAAQAERVAAGLFTGLLGRPRVARQPRTCEVCGAGFLVRPSEADRKFCSRKCYGAAVGLRQQGEAHPGFRHGMTKERTSARQRLRKHPAYAEWREKVYARDGFRCRSCLAGGELHAHHHAPWSGDVRLRLKVSNGITLCTDCHRLWHAYDRKGMFEGKESLLQAKVKSALEDYGFWVYNVPGTPYGTSGIPDLVVCFNGMFGGLECKVFPNYLSETQRHAAEGIRSAGGVFMVVQSEDDIGRVIEAFETRTASGGWVVDDVSQLDQLEGRFA